jgi:hypothetical protein
MLMSHATDYVVVFQLQSEKPSALPGFEPQTFCTGGQVKVIKVTEVKVIKVST